MINTTVRVILAAALVSSVAACGGGADSTNPIADTTPQSLMGQVPLSLSDASSEDWATIGVKLLSLSLTPQGGGAAVTVYTANPAPMINLEQLDQLSEILGNVSIPVGTYTGATLTIAGNAGDVVLTAAADPEAGFAVAPGTTIDPSLIQIQHPQGTAPDLTVPVRLTFESPLIVSTGQNNALDLEFDLAHPAFIVGHTPPGAGATVWAVNFDGPVRRRRVDDLTHLVLRHLYGSVTAVSADNTAFTVTKDLPRLPATAPETAVATAQSLQVQADTTNGTLFYDLDAKTGTTIKNFSAESADLAGKYVRVAARYQEDGALIATRIWTSSSFNSVWISPEGHVLHVDPASDVVTVSNESGVGVPVSVDDATQFYFRTPANALADATPVGTGTVFLASHDLVRGFKVHVNVVDPLATPLVAQSIDIETAAYDGRISAADSSGFTYTRNFRTSGDDYSVGLSYISAATANGQDAGGTAITGFKWWDFAFPTLVNSGAAAISNFVNQTSGQVQFGGTVGAVSSWGVSYARWNDPAHPNGWSVPGAILIPTPIPLGAVASGFAGTSFTMTVAGGANAVTVNVGMSMGSATLVYQVDRTGAVVSISPVDVTTAAGITALTNGLALAAPVKVFGLAQADGTLKADVLLYYTGDRPNS